MTAATADSDPLIPDDNAPVPPARTRPTWWVVYRVRTIAFTLVGLAVALSLASTYYSWRTAVEAEREAVRVNERLAELEEYVEGRGQYRDAETDRLERLIGGAICDLLESLPPVAVLEEPRQRWNCGPGRPWEEFPPEVQEQAGAPSVASPPPTAPAVEPPPVGMGGAQPDPPSPQAPYYPPGSSPPSVDPNPDPLVDLSVVTDPLLDVLCPLVCL